MTERCVRSCHLVSGGDIRSLIAMKGIKPGRRALTDSFFTRRSRRSSLIVSKRRLPAVRS
jgi:hypothetical protein